MGHPKAFLELRGGHAPGFLVLRSLFRAPGAGLKTGHYKKDLHMKPKKLNPGLLWMQFEDVLAPRLGLSVKERAVYSYLLRHSLVVGKLRLQFAVIALARTLRLSIGATRQAVRRLDELGALRVLERSKSGHLAEMRVPEKIRAIRPGKNGALEDTGQPPASTL
jgi:hypothetical protein